MHDIFQVHFLLHCLKNVWLSQIEISENDQMGPTLKLVVNQTNWA